MEVNTTILLFTNVLDIEEVIDVNVDFDPTKETSTIMELCL
jgi:hypothetical protein